jgi:23S rRNA pseudouridine2457 synthase
MSKYLKFYKPFEVLCQFTDPSGRANLKDFIKVPGVYPAGRLDYRSEGLLILTDDGNLIQHITDPRYAHPKTYFAQVEGIVTVEALWTLSNEILLPGVQNRRAKARMIPDPDLPPRAVPVRPYHPTSWIEITLFEGKKHQVRRMTASVGFPTLRLVRVAIGGVTIEGLEPGKWQPLQTAEVNEIKGFHKRLR